MKVRYDVVDFLFELLTSSLVLTTKVQKPSVRLLDSPNSSEADGQLSDLKPEFLPEEHIHSAVIRFQNLAFVLGRVPALDTISQP
jgi:hypothetical protein